MQFDVKMSRSISMLALVNNGTGNLCCLNFDWFWDLFSCYDNSVFNCRRAFWDKRISQEVVGDALGEVWFWLESFHSAVFPEKH